MATAVSAFFSRYFAFAMRLFKRYGGFLMNGGPVRVFWMAGQ
jgi:hypothetical protein